MLEFLDTILSIWGEYWPDFMFGLWVTLWITFFSIIFSTLIGLAVGYVTSLPVRRSLLVRMVVWFLGEYVDLIRGTPLLVQAIFFYFAFVPMVVNPFMLLIGFRELSPEVAGVVIISFNAGAYLAEIFRGGIQAIDPGQLEAGRSLGLSYWQSMRKIILPQTVRNMIPAILNQFIISLKDTSLLMIIGAYDLLGKGKIAYQTNFRVFETMLIIALIYYVVIKALSILFKRIEECLSTR